MHGPQGQKALRQLEKEAQMEIEDPDRHLAEEDETSGVPHRGRGKGRGRGRGRGARGRGRGKRDASTAAAASSKPAVAKATGQTGVAEGDGAGEEPGDVEIASTGEPPQKKAKTSVTLKMKTSKKRAILKRSNSQSPGKLATKPAPAKDPKKESQHEQHKDCVEYKRSSHNCRLL